MSSLLKMVGLSSTSTAPAVPFSFLSPSTFSWSTAPLSDVRAPLTAAVLYVVLVLSLSRYMQVVRGGRGIETKRLQAVHNLILSIGSLAMFLGTLREVCIYPRRF